MDKDRINNIASQTSNARANYKKSLDYHAEKFKDDPNQEHLENEIAKATFTAAKLAIGAEDKAWYAAGIMYCSEKYAACLVANASDPCCN